MKREIVFVIFGWTAFIVLMCVMCWQIISLFIVDGVVYLYNIIPVLILITSIGLAIVPIIFFPMSLLIMMTVEVFSGGERHELHGR